jgi:hypothetical protein
MRCLFVAAALCVSAASLNADPLTRNERNRAMSELHAGRKQFLDSLRRLSEAQWKFKPAADRWSIAECAEHIAVSEDSIMGTIRERILKSPVADAAMRKQAEGKDEKVIVALLDRSQKAQAPGELRPTGKWKTRDEVVAAFKASRDRNIHYIDTTEDDLRAHVVPSPVLGPLDAFQFVLLLAAHTERHVEQIREVMADPKFPRK